MTDAKTKSRLPRTGTLVFLAVVLLIGGAVLSVGLPYHRNQTAMAAIDEIGGRTESMIVRPRWLPAVVSDRHLEALYPVQRIDLRYARLRDSDLQQLQGLTEVEYLQLDNTKIGDAGLQYLIGLTNLKELYLRNCLVGDAGLRHLGHLTSLRKLSLINTRVSDAGLDHLQGLTHLEYLFLDGTKVTTSGFNRLQTALPTTTIFDAQSNH